MPVSKLNVLHWHLVDDESFPLELQSHPELAQYGKYEDGQTYNAAQVREVIALAKYNGVQVIPEIDTPAHVRSWALAPKWVDANLDIKCNGGTGYNGQFDVSKLPVWDFAKDVIKEINDIFATASNYIHLGGD